MAGGDFRGSGARPEPWRLWAASCEPGEDQGDLKEGWRFGLMDMSKQWRAPLWTAGSEETERTASDRCCRPHTCAAW